MSEQRNREPMETSAVISNREIKDCILVKDYTKSYFFMAALTFVGGFLDIYTFLTRGHVFANTQTTNLVSLGYYLTIGEFQHLTQYLFPILSCVLGGVVSTLFMKYSKDVLHRKLLIFEILVLIAIGFIEDKQYNMIVNCTLSFITAYQLNMFRKYREYAHNTTIATGNLRQLGEFIANDIINYRAGLEKTSLKYASLLFMFFAGAIISTISTNILQEQSIWICGMLLFLIIVIGMRIEKRYKLA